MYIGIHRKDPARAPIVFRRSIILALVMSMLTAGVALADNLDVDGDALESGLNNLSFGEVCPGTTRNKDATLAIRATGHPGTGTANFANAASVSVTRGSISDSALSASASVGQINLPTNWLDLGNGALSAGVVSAVTFTAPANSGSTNLPYGATIVYLASGLRSQSTPTPTLSRSTTLTVSADVLPASHVDCAPPPPADSTPPVLTIVVGTPNGGTPDGTDGWFVTKPVTGTATASDTATGGSNISELECIPAAMFGSATGLTVSSMASRDFSVDAEGTTTLSCTATDSAGNVSSPATTKTVKIDTAAPVVTVDGFSEDQSFALGSLLPTPSCSATDATPGSGVDSSTLSPTKTDDTRNGNGVGSVTYKCSVKDHAGNEGTDTRTFHVNYATDGGIRQPIASDNSSVFKRGRAVPVKFGLVGDYPTGFSTSGWTIKKVSVSCAGLAGETEVEAVSVTPDSVFRYDSSADQYIYNADFRDAAAGSCWFVRVTLDDPARTQLKSAYFMVTK